MLAVLHRFRLRVYFGSLVSAASVICDCIYVHVLALAWSLSPDL